MSGPMTFDRLTPELLLRAYASGVFPMAESRDASHVFWVDPRERGILPLESFHVPRSLRKLVRRRTFRVTADRAFRAVMEGCAAPGPDRAETWINAEILNGYVRLHEMGFAHSLECWRDGQLAGGLYGVSLGGAFFGESMFSRETGASKVALVHLVARLRLGGFRLLDAQFVTDHLRSFGAIEVPARRYHRLLAAAIPAPARFYSDDDLLPSVLDSELASLFRQSVTQTS